MPPKVLYKINNRIERDSQTSFAIHQFSHLLLPFLFILLSFHFVSLLEFLIKNNKKTHTKGEREGWHSQRIIVKIAPSTRGINVTRNNEDSYHELFVVCLMAI